MIICDDIHRSVKQDVNKRLLFYCLWPSNGGKDIAISAADMKICELHWITEHDALMFRK